MTNRERFLAAYDKAIRASGIDPKTHAVMMRLANISLSNCAPRTLVPWALLDACLDLGIPHNDVAIVAYVTM